MELYHGSNIIVECPEIRPRLRALDFGAGFYATTSRKQAEVWAKTVIKRRRKGEPILNVYNFNENYLEQLNVLVFKTADESWLDFVVANRKELIFPSPYDLIIGPVANDTTLSVIDDYMDGKYTREEAIDRLMPQRLTDQYAFLTDKALSLLHFERSENL